MKTLIALLIICSVAHQSQAQIWKNIEKKIGKKIEQQADKRLERKIDKTIDRGFNKIEDATEVKAKDKPVEGKGQKEVSNQGSTQVSEILSSMGANETLASSYKFNFGVTYEMSTSKKKQKPLQSTIWISDNSGIGMSTDMQKGVFMIMDGDRMITFMEKDKSYMSFNYKSMQEGIFKSAAENSDTNEDYKIVKTGSENILGYNCDVYTIEGKDYSGKVSVAPSLNVTGFMKSFASMTRNAKMPTADFAPGMMLKMISTDTKTGEVTTMVATDIIKAGKVLNTSDYTNKGGF